MALATIPGYPRIGKKRQLKRALEGYWSGKRTADDLEATAASVRLDAWATQQAVGLDQDLTIAGMGPRSKRYSMLVEDGVVQQLNIEEARGVEVSGAATILEQL